MFIPKSVLRSRIAWNDPSAMLGIVKLFQIEIPIVSGIGGVIGV